MKDSLDSGALSNGYGAFAIYLSGGSNGIHFQNTFNTSTWVCDFRVSEQENELV